MVAVVRVSDTEPELEKAKTPPLPPLDEAVLIVKVFELITAMLPSTKTTPPIAPADPVFTITELRVMVLVEAELEYMVPPLPLVVVGEVNVTPDNVISTLLPDLA